MGRNRAVSRPSVETVIVVDAHEHQIRCKTSLQDLLIIIEHFVYFYFSSNFTNSQQDGGAARSFRSAFTLAQFDPVLPFTAQASVPLPAKLLWRSSGAFSDSLQHERESALFWCDTCSLSVKLLSGEMSDTRKRAGSTALRSALLP